MSKTTISILLISAILFASCSSLAPKVDKTSIGNPTIDNSEKQAATENIKEIESEDTSQTQTSQLSDDDSLFSIEKDLNQTVLPEEDFSDL